MSKRKRLSVNAQKRIDLGGKMMASILERGAIPEIVIGAKPGNAELHQVDYIISSPLEAEKVRYVLTRVIGLLDGTISRDN